MTRIDNRKAKAHARVAKANSSPTHKGSDISSFSPPGGMEMTGGASDSRNRAGMVVDGPQRKQHLGGYKRGGRVPSKTNINIVIAPQGGAGAGAAPPPPPPMMLPPGPPPGGPPGAPLPPGAGPGGGPGPMARGGRTPPADYDCYKSGGRVMSGQQPGKGDGTPPNRVARKGSSGFKFGGKVMTAGARSEMGREEKAKGFTPVTPAEQGSAKGGKPLMPVGKKC